MEHQTLRDFVARRTQSAEALDAMAAVVAPLTGLDEQAALLRQVAARAREGRFHVLLVGCFSSGKSTLLNAMVGEPVLPVKVNPCTAILTELVHGEVPAVTVHQTDGSERSLTVADFLDEFQLRTGEEEAGQEATDRFGAVDRAVVQVPLPLLADGVALLDTPGLDDDEARTARTLAALPEADAVIFVLNASRFLTDLERQTLTRHLLSRGLTNLFFPVTMVDLLASMSDDPDRDLAELTLKGRKVLGPLCQVEGEDRFAQRFFPLNARGGLFARYDPKSRQRRPQADLDALQSTGLAPFEESLEHFLVAERGEAQLALLASTARRIRAEVARRAQLDQATADASVAELEERLASLQPRFEELTRIAERVARTVDRFVDRQADRVFRELRDFMVRTEADLPEAVDSFDLGTIGGLDLLTPAGRRRVEATISRELDTWLSERTRALHEHLRPGLEEGLQRLRREVAADARDFDQVAGVILETFAGPSIELDLSSGESTGDDVDPTERWVSLAIGALLLSPGAMAAGWSEGYEGALRGTASRLAVRLAVLGLGVLLGPIGWVGLLLYAVSDGVLLAATGGSRLRKVREQVAKNLDGKLVAQADASEQAVRDQVIEALTPLREAIVEAASSEARELQATLEQTVAARARAEAEASARQHTWSEALTDLDRLLGTLG